MGCLYWWRNPRPWGWHHSWLALSPTLPMEDYISCLVRSLQPKRILRMQVPDSIPTMLNFRVSLRHYPSLGPMVVFHAIRKLVSCCQHLLGDDPITGKRPLGTHQPASPGTSPIKVTNYHAAHPQSCAEFWKRMCGPCCRPWWIRSYLKSEQTHSLGSLFIRLHYLVCGMWQPRWRLAGVAQR